MCNNSFGGRCSCRCGSGYGRNQASSEGYYWRKGTHEMSDGLARLEQSLDCVYAGYRDMQISKFIDEFDESIRCNRCRGGNCACGDFVGSQFGSPCSFVYGEGAFGTKF